MEYEMRPVRIRRNGEVKPSGRPLGYLVLEAQEPPSYPMRERMENNERKSERNIDRNRLPVRINPSHQIRR